MCLCVCAICADHNLCALYVVRCALYVVRCTLCVVRCALCVVRCAVGGLEGGGAGLATGTGETAAALSGGGFSNYFDRPSYQDQAVASYLKNSLPDQKMWNKDGAGFPDVSAQVSREWIVDERVDCG